MDPINLKLVKPVGASCQGDPKQREADLSSGWDN